MKIRFEKLSQQEHKRRNLNILYMLSIFIVLYLVALTLFNTDLEFYHAIIFYVAYKVIKLFILFIKENRRCELIESEVE